MQKLVRDGKVRYIGLSNETPYGVHEFVRVAEQHDLPRVATVQNPYCADQPRRWTTAWTKPCTAWACRCSPIRRWRSARSPASTTRAAWTRRTVRDGRLAKFERMREQRWARPEALAAARRYNALAREHGLTPTRMALAWCYTQLARGQHHHRRDQRSRSWRKTWTPGARSCRPNCWRRSTRSAGSCATPRPEGSRHGEEGPRQRNARHRVPARRTASPSPSIPTSTWSTAARSTAPQVLGFDPFTVVKTLVMEDEKARPLIVLMHGNRKVSTKNLARQIGAKSVEPCKPEVANRHSGYLVGGTSPFGTRKADAGVHRGDHPRACRASCSMAAGAATWWASTPQVCVDLLGAKPVHCALDEA